MQAFAKKLKQGEATPQETSKAEQQTQVILPLKPHTNRVESMKVSEVLSAKLGAYETLRKARADAKYVGKREKRRKQKEEAIVAAAAKQKS